MISLRYQTKRWKIGRHNHAGLTIPKHFSMAIGVQTTCHLNIISLRSTLGGKLDIFEAQYVLSNALI
jgi:hypothetical protein